jgi:hypothetical protein
MVFINETNLRHTGEPIKRGVPEQEIIYTARQTGGYEMKHIKLALMVTALVVLAAACSNIQITRTSGSLNARRVSIAKAKVVEVDHENHTAILKDKHGRQSVNFGPDAPNFSKVKVGDIVIAEVLETMTVSRKASDDEPSAGGFETTQRDPLAPGAQKVTVVESSARVEKIDYETRMITLSGTNGKRVTIEAGPEIKSFNEIKQGDLITMQIVKQTIIRVEAP